MTLSTCDASRGTTAEAFVWRGECGRLERVMHCSRSASNCQSALTIPVSEFAHGPLYAEVRRDISMRAIVRASWVQAPVGPPSGLLWGCCGGEYWVTLPLLGTMQVPASYEATLRASALPTHVACFLLLWLLVALGACACAAATRRHCPTTYRCARYRRWTMHLLAPLLSYVAIAACACGAPGRHLLTRVNPHPFAAGGVLQPDQLPDAIARLDEWLAVPSTAPLSGGGPLVVPLFTPAFASSVATRVAALRHTHWTSQASLSFGQGLFVVGRKYSGTTRGGLLLHPAAQAVLGQSLWDGFGDVYEGVRHGAETTLGAPCHLSRRNHPPSFLIHMSTAISSHHEAFDVHTDALMPHTMRARLLEDVADGRPNWAEASCEWRKQLSLLVALQLPSRHESGTVFFSRSGGQWLRSTLEHQLGQMMIFEAMRPHSLKPFSWWDAGSPELRMTVHAFAVPCQASAVVDADAPTEWWISGVLGGSNRNAQEVDPQ